ncbi:MAG: nucleotidyltransferase domain-containing protein [Aureliella sp.]
MIDNPKLRTHVAHHPYPLVFATLSGAHLYGFPSPDSDFDLRGTHVLPLAEVVGLHDSAQTCEKEGVYDGLEIDLVTHDVEKFFRLMLRPNGYVLEQVLSPLVVHATPEHEELCGIARKCVTRHHAHHYLGFAASQWKKFLATESPEAPGSFRLKPLLYVYRVLLTGIHLMRTGRVEANLRVLVDGTPLRFLDELIEQKRSSQEKGMLEHCDLSFHQLQYEALRGQLEQAHTDSHLPEQGTALEQLNDLLVRLRLAS